MNVSNTSLLRSTQSLKLEEPEDATEVEHQYEFAIFVMLVQIAVSILLIRVLRKYELIYVPESIAVVIIGAATGLLLQTLDVRGVGFPPAAFFVVLLPPIVFESGFALEKTRFFENIGSIFVFAVFGTILSAIVIAAGVYICGQAAISHRFTWIESFVFGSFISAVDPVATLACFKTLKVDPLLHMLVFGESVTNDAVAIVLTTTALELRTAAFAEKTSLELIGFAVGRFCLVFFVSSLIGTLFGLVSALLTKHVDLRDSPATSISLLFIFSYLSYALSDAFDLSGIMATFFTGMVMSHYTQRNLDESTRKSVEMLFQTLSFLAETCVFAYLGMSIFTFQHVLDVPLACWSIGLCLLGRTANICPLSFLLNRCRSRPINGRTQVVLWFSGLRGAVAFALSLQLDLAAETSRLLVTTTLIIVLFTIVVFGGGTLPLIRILDRQEASASKSQNRASVGNRRRPPRRVKSKTSEAEMENGEDLNDGLAAPASATGPSTFEEAAEINVRRKILLSFAELDERFFVPFFTRKWSLAGENSPDGRPRIATQNGHSESPPPVASPSSSDDKRKPRRSLANSGARASSKQHKRERDDGYALLPIRECADEIDPEQADSDASQHSDSDYEV